jgi:UDP-glucose 4-epimerase
MPADVYGGIAATAKKIASVREIIKLVLEATNKADTKVNEVERRAGDPAFLCADIYLAKSAMGFTSQYSLEESVRSLFD